MDHLGNRISIGLSFFIVYQIINIGLVSKLKKWQANGDYIAKVSIEGW